MRLPEGIGFLKNLIHRLFVYIIIIKNIYRIPMRSFFYIFNKNNCKKKIIQNFRLLDFISTSLCI